MKPGWLVVWTDRHTGGDGTYAICEAKEDALTVAERYAAVAFAHYRQRAQTTPLGIEIYRRSVEDAYTVTVTPQFIRERGETT